MVVSNDWSNGTTRSRNFGVRVSDDTAAKNPWSPRSPGSTPHRPPPLPMVPPPFRAGSPPLPAIAAPAPVDTTPLPWDTTNRDESTMNLGLWHISWKTKLVTRLAGERGMNCSTGTQRRERTPYTQPVCLFVNVSRLITCLPYSPGAAKLSNADDYKIDSVWTRHWWTEEKIIFFYESRYFKEKYVLGRSLPKKVWPTLPYTIVSRKTKSVNDEVFRQNTLVFFYFAFVCRGLIWSKKSHDAVPLKGVKIFDPV